MGRKIVAEIAQPVHDAAGNVVLEPGARFPEGAGEVEGLAPGQVRWVVAEEPDKPAEKQAEKPAEKQAAEPASPPHAPPPAKPSSPPGKK